jgi:ATP-dependent Lon protease
MRDFRDAKTMAQTLRDSLTSKAVPISHSESLELVSKMFGVADWNTLSAMLKDQRQKVAPDQKQQDTASYPAIPVRDYVPPADGVSAFHRARKNHACSRASVRP